MRRRSLPKTMLQENIQGNDREESMKKVKEEVENTTCNVLERRQGKSRYSKQSREAEESSKCADVNYIKQ